MNESNTARSPLRVGSLFAGIGGFDLAARWMGWRTEWYSEIEPYAAAVMKKHFPEAVNLGDVTMIDGKQAPPVDLLCGGFPCQDISLAGKGAGLSGERSGLWSHYARLIDEIRPRWVVAENVSALRSRGLDKVLGEIAALGYDAEWHCIPAAYVGAPHRRDRVWIIAYPNGGRRDAGDRLPVLSFAGQDHRLVADPRWRGGDCSNADDTTRRTAHTGAGEASVVADAYRQLGHEGGENDAARNEERCAPDRGSARQLEMFASAAMADANGEPRDERWPCDADEGEGRGHADRSGVSAHEVVNAASLRLERASRAEGLRGWGSDADPSGWWESEPDVGRVAHGVPARVDRLRCLGNAVVPQVPLLIFQAIQAAEDERCGA